VGGVLGGDRYTDSSESLPGAGTRGRGATHPHAALRRFLVRICQPDLNSHVSDLAHQAIGRHRKEVGHAPRLRNGPAWKFTEKEKSRMKGRFEREGERTAFFTRVFFY